MTTFPIQWNSLPYGCNEIDEAAANELSKIGNDKEEVCCCIKQCNKRLTRVRRGIKDPNVFCPEHQIRVSSRPTYVYKRRDDNLILEPLLFSGLSKVENWRIGNENSEDALTWNIIVPILRVGGLNVLFEQLTGQKPKNKPELFLWGNAILDETTTKWAQLSKIRDELEPNFPIPTEPDIAIVAPGQAILLIEAKFGSRNPSFSRKDDYEDCIDDFKNRYWADPDPINRDVIGPDSLDQLCRNAVFLSWLAKEYNADQRFLINLVRSVDEKDVEERMQKILNPNVVSFQRKTWEELYLIVKQLVE